MKFIALALSLSVLTGCTLSAGSLMFWSSGDAVVTSSDSERLYEEGMSAFHRTDYGLAQEKFQAAIEANPKLVAAWLGLAGSYDHLRRFDLADRAYNEVERLAGRSASLLNNRGYSYYLRGDYVKARIFYEAAEQMAPDDPVVARNIQLLQTRL